MGVKVVGDRFDQVEKLLERKTLNEMGAFEEVARFSGELQTLLGYQQVTLIMLTLILLWGSKILLLYSFHLKRGLDDIFRQFNALRR